LICIFCGSDNVTPIKKYQSFVIPKEFQLFGCLVCKSRFFDGCDDVALENLYDEQANQNAAIYQDFFKESRYWRNEVKAIKKLANPLPIGSVLDIGCRTGDFLMHWPAAIQRVGVELSEVSSTIAHRRGLDVINASIENYTIGQKFDAVTCYALIEHLINPTLFVQKLGPLVSKDGVLAILIPTWECLKLAFIEVFGYRWHMYSPPLHINYYSRQKLDQTVSELGFKLIGRRYTSGGLFNPFQRIRYLNRAAARAIWEIESATPIHKLPIFDHMYSYYKKL
jgi:SAM-dependent methyltransferase